MREVVIVDAVRTPFGRRNGGLSTMHSLDLLGKVQHALFERTGVDPAEVGQVVGGPGEVVNGYHSRPQVRRTQQGSDRKVFVMPYSVAIF